MKLSILIPTVPARESLLSRLLFTLDRQLNEEVEVLIYKDNGEATYGQKVNKMVGMAKGDYITIFDDDDLIPEDYVSTILEKIKDDPDFIGYYILYLSDGKFQYLIEHNGDNKEWHGPNFTRRGFSPKCVVKKDIFSKFTFGDSYTSDQTFSHQIDHSGLIKKHIFIPRCMYYYDFWSDYMLGASSHDESFQKHIHIQRDVGIYPFSKEKFIWI